MAEIALNKIFSDPTVNHSPNGWDLDKGGNDT